MKVAEDEACEAYEGQSTAQAVPLKVLRAAWASCRTEAERRIRLKPTTQRHTHLLARDVQ